MFEDIRVPIGFIGEICSGKDTAGEILVKCFDYRRVAFGDRIRTLWDMYQSSKESAFILLTLFSHKFIDRREEFFKLTDGIVDKRTFLQKVGTWARKVDNHVWIRQVTLTFPPVPAKIVCTDIRRKSELEYLKACGFHFIFIEAPVELRRERFAAREGQVMTEDINHSAAEIEIQALKPLCDVVITNDGDRGKLSTALLCAIQKINTKWGDKHEY